MEQEPTKAEEPIRTSGEPVEERIDSLPPERGNAGNGRAAFVAAEPVTADPADSTPSEGHDAAADAPEVLTGGAEVLSLDPKEVSAGALPRPPAPLPAPEGPEARFPDLSTPSPVPAVTDRLESPPPAGENLAFSESVPPLPEAPVTIVPEAEGRHTGEALAENVGPGAVPAELSVPTDTLPPADEATGFPEFPPPHEPVTFPEGTAPWLEARPPGGEEEPTLFAPAPVPEETGPTYRRAATLRLRRLRLLRPERLLPASTAAPEGVVTTETVSREAAPYAATAREPYYDTGPNWMLAFVCLWAGGTSLNEAWYVAGQAGMGPALLRNVTFLGYGVLGFGLIGFALEALQHGKRRGAAATLLAALVPALLTLAGVILLVLSNDPGRRI